MAGGGGGGGQKKKKKKKTTGTFFQGRHHTHTNPNCRCPLNDPAKKKEKEKEKCSFRLVANSPPKGWGSKRLDKWTNASSSFLHLSYLHGWAGHMAW